MSAGTIVRLIQILSSQTELSFKIQTAFYEDAPALREKEKGWSLWSIIDDSLRFNFLNIAYELQTIQRFISTIQAIKRTTVKT